MDKVISRYRVFIHGDVQREPYRVDAGLFPPKDRRRKAKITSLEVRRRYLAISLDRNSVTWVVVEFVGAN